MSHFTITPEEDALNCIWLHDMKPSHNRIFRVSVSQFISRDQHSGQDTTSTWVYFKVFRFSETNKEFEKYQQVCLRPIEAERLLQEATQILFDVMTGVYLNHAEIPRIEAENFNISADQDRQLCHSFVDLISSARRLIRVSHRKYNNNDPTGSSYLQVKHFVRKLEGENFTRKGLVTTTLLEFREMTTVADQLLVSIKKLTNKCL